MATLVRFITYLRVRVRVRVRIRVRVRVRVRVKVKVKDKDIRVRVRVRDKVRVRVRVRVRLITYDCGRGNPLSVQSSAWSENVASTDALREPTNVRTPVSVPYGEHL